VWPNWTLNPPVHELATVAEFDWFDVGRVGLKVMGTRHCGTTEYSKAACYKREEVAVFI